MTAKRDLMGERFGRLTVIAPHESDTWGKAQWLCQCDCGGAHIVRVDHLLRDKVKHCLACEPEKRQVLHIEAWYHVTTVDALGVRVQGQAGFAVCTLDGHPVLTPRWIEDRHQPRRQGPVMVTTMRELIQARVIKIARTEPAIRAWLIRNSGKVTRHSYLEGERVQAEWYQRTGAMPGEQQTADDIAEALALIS